MLCGLGIFLWIEVRFSSVCSLRRTPSQNSLCLSLDVTIYGAARAQLRSCFAFWNGNHKKYLPSHDISFQNSTKKTCPRLSNPCTWSESNTSPTLCANCPLRNYGTLMHAVCDQVRYLRCSVSPYESLILSLVSIIWHGSSLIF
jgi:hypothetical protein